MSIMDMAMELNKAEARITDLERKLAESEAEISKDRERICILVEDCKRVEKQLAESKAREEEAQARIRKLEGKLELAMRTYTGPAVEELMTRHDAAIWDMAIEAIRNAPAKCGSYGDWAKMRCILLLERAKAKKCGALEASR